MDYSIYDKALIRNWAKAKKDGANIDLLQKERARLWTMAEWYANAEGIKNIHGPFLPQYGE